MSIDDVAKKFRLPYFHPALVDFMDHYTPENSATYSISGQQSTVACSNLNFPKVQIWSGVHIQSKEFHNADEVMPSQLINACPPCDEWPLGLYGSVIVNTDKSKLWPQSDLDGV